MTTQMRAVEVARHSARVGHMPCVQLTILLSLGSGALIAAPARTNVQPVDHVQVQAVTATTAEPPGLELLEYLGSLQRDEAGWYGPEDVNETDDVDAREAPRKTNRSAARGEQHTP